MLTKLKIEEKYWDFNLLKTQTKLTKIISPATKLFILLKEPLFSLLWDTIEISKVELKDDVRNIEAEDELWPNCELTPSTEVIGDVADLCWLILMLLVEVDTDDDV